MQTDISMASQAKIGFDSAIASKDSFEYFSNEVMQNIKSTIDAGSNGVFNKIVHNHFKIKGKMIRPYIIYELGRLLNAPLDDLIAWATSCELLHNATLIHDDIQDRDTHRRGQLTLWTQFGDAQAINAGDLLMMSSMQPVLMSKISAETKIQLLTCFSKMACKIVDGQSLEFELNTFKSPEKSLPTYLRCVQLKTATLFSDLAHGVALIANVDIQHIQNIENLFDQIGVLFQMQDDVIDLYGDKQRDTKGCDIKEGKMSFLIATHITHNPEDIDLIRSLLMKPRFETKQKDIELIENLFATKSTLKVCLDKIQSAKEKVLEHKALKNDANLKKFIHELLNKILKPIIIK